MKRSRSGCEVVASLVISIAAPFISSRSMSGFDTGATPSRVEKKAASRRAR
jgi:hypothetical protein